MNLTTLDGGELIAANGVTLGVGDTLAGTGEVNAKIVQAAGSIIAATANLTLGDVNDASGFYSNGDVDIDNNTVTMNDMNDAVFDSGASVALGDTGAGTLAADIEDEVYGTPP